MFLKVFLFALSLSSLTAEKDPSCSELLLEDPHVIVGDWTVHAIGTDSDEILNGLKMLTTSWTRVTKTEEDNKYHVEVYDKINDECYLREGFAMVWADDLVKVSLTGKPFNIKYQGYYLKTHSQNVAVFLSTATFEIDNTFVTGKNLVLLKRGEHVPEKTMELYRKQAKCEDMQFVTLTAKDLCS
ncbi:hypothetical protein NL108_007897 [Boleophthalmus pectinirostris]|nr:hypothetical protein NL108_007897 [Boleophthalmus pectinirostris]